MCLAWICWHEVMEADRACAWLQRHAGQGHHLCRCKPAIAQQMSCTVPALH